MVEFYALFWNGPYQCTQKKHMNKHHQLLQLLCLPPTLTLKWAHSRDILFFHPIPVNHRKTLQLYDKDGPKQSVCDMFVTILTQSRVTLCFTLGIKASSIRAMRGDSWHKCPRFVSCVKARFLPHGFHGKGNDHTSCICIKIPLFSAEENYIIQTNGWVSELMNVFLKK